MPTKPIKMLSGIGQAEMNAYFHQVPAPSPVWNQFFPVVQTFDDLWKTLGNQGYAPNVAADPVALGSSAPIKSRKGTKVVSGGFGVFKTARIKEEDEIERFNELQSKASQFTAPEQYQQILNWVGDDISFVRNAAIAQAGYLSWALLSSACDLGYVSENSPYMASLSNITYPVDSWQKAAVATSWADTTSDILGDIEDAINTAESNNKILKKIKINKKWFKYVQANEDIQKFAASYIQNALSMQTTPTREQVNQTIQRIFDIDDLEFEIIDEKVSREAVDGTAVTANPFADGVAVFTTERRVGSFQYKIMSSRPDVVNVAESFYRIERLFKSDPDLEKTLVKFKGMPVIDSFADNFYLKIDAVAW